MSSILVFWDPRGIHSSARGRTNFGKRFTKTWKNSAHLISQNGWWVLALRFCQSSGFSSRMSSGQFFGTNRQENADRQFLAPSDISSHLWDTNKYKNTIHITFALFLACDGPANGKNQNNEWFWLRYSKLTLTNKRPIWGKEGCCRNGVRTSS